MRRNIIVVAAAFLLAGMLLAGCGRNDEAPYTMSSTLESYEALEEDEQSIVQSVATEEPKEEIPKEDGQNTVQSAATEEPEEEMGELEKGSNGRWEYVDFSVIEENHEILEYDICEEPRYDWENTLLGEEGRLRQMAEEHKKYAEWRHSVGDVHVPLDFDLEYFPFDFNDDGLEDYLICISSWEYCGSGGNLIGIYVQEEGDTLKQVLSITSRLHQGDGVHARFTVLNEKTDGYYAIVLTSNRILRYDNDTNWYEFHEGE